MPSTVGEQSFVQHLMARKFLTEDEAIQLHDSLEHPRDPLGPAELDNYIAALNRTLDFTGIQLRKAMLSDGQVFWGVANTVSDAAARGGTAYAGWTVQLFKAVAEYMLEAAADADPPAAGEAPAEPTMELNAAINLAQGKIGKKVTLKEAEGALRSLAKSGWLKIVGGHVTFGVRAFLELPEVKAWNNEARYSAAGRGRKRRAEQDPEGEGSGAGGSKKAEKPDSAEEDDEDDAESRRASARKARKAAAARAEVESPLAKKDRGRTRRNKVVVDDEEDEE